jgi:hypothetical protein
MIFMAIIPIKMLELAKKELWTLTAGEKRIVLGN